MQEESAELIQAISKFKRGDFTTSKDLIGEIADNIIMLNQTIKIFDISEDRLQEEITKKLSKLKSYLNK